MATNEQENEATAANNQRSETASPSGQSNETAANGQGAAAATSEPQRADGQTSDGRGQTVLLTGGSSGIGLELARLFARDGYRLILVADDEAKLSRATQELEARSGQPITAIVQDLAEEDAADRVADQLAAQGTEVDVLVNDAGIGVYGQFLETDVEEENRLLHINIVALTRLTKRLLPGMVARKRGRILNLASVASFMPGPLMTVYYASKAYVLSFSEGLGEELRGTGVTVTALCPPPTETNFDDRAQIGQARAFRSRFASVADPASVAQAGYVGLLQGKRIVTPNLTARLMAASPRVMPRGLMVRVSKVMQSQVRNPVERKD